MNGIEPVKKRFGLSHLSALASILLLVTLALAQDPLKVLPQAYKLQFENDWVKVTRVHYAPHEKLPPHQHTQSASAYVYLNDSGPVVFKHIDLLYGAVTRPATTEGTFRLYQGLKEVHEVESLSDVSSDFLRVEFKTEPINEKTLRGRFHRVAYPAGENFQKVQFENEQIRITRLVCAVPKSLDVSTSANEPVLLVALSPASFKMSEAQGKLASFKLGMGQTKWFGENEQRKIENTGTSLAEFLRFDFKTQPRKRMLEKNKNHEHPKQ